MFRRKLIYGTILSLLALVFIFGSIISNSQNSKELRVIFLDVGQGDAILISEGSYQMLVDGGRSGKVILEKLGEYIPFWDRTIEIMVATHPDQDHIGGLISVLNSYKVEKILKTNMESSSKTYQSFQKAISEEKSEYIEAKKGISFKFPDGTSAEIIYPLSSVSDMPENQSNSSSVAIKVNYGENNFLLTGDLPEAKEKEIISSGTDIDSDFLKVAHHGSKYSTGEEFLNKVNPVEAIISVGKGNTYGHPNEEIINLLKEKNINILRTDEKGDIIYNCPEDSVCLAH